MLYVATMQLLHYNKLQPAKQVYFDTLPIRQNHATTFTAKIHFSSHKYFSFDVLFT